MIKRKMIMITKIPYPQNDDPSSTANGPETPASPAAAMILTPRIPNFIASVFHKDNCSVVYTASYHAYEILITRGGFELFAIWIMKPLKRLVIVLS